METAAKSCINCFHVLEDSNVCPLCGFDESKHKIIFYHLNPRTVLHGKYLIGKALGEDSFGITYAASEIDSGQKVVIKELFPPEIAKRINYLTNVVRIDANYTALFNAVEKKFTDIAKKLVLFSAQSKIIRYRDFFLENDSAYIVEEFIEGVTLAEHLRNNGDNKLSFEQTMRLVRPIILELGNIHKQEIVHAAINPGNIFLNAEEEMILTNFDFIGGKITSPGKETALINKSYLAPERYADAAKEGPWTDIYSLAAVIYTAVTANELPAANEREELEVENKLSFVSFKDVGVEITPKDEETLLKALSLEPQDRYQTMEDFVENLEIFKELVFAEEIPDEQKSPEEISALEAAEPPVIQEEAKKNPPQETPAESAMSFEEQSICGNTPGNIVNGGMVAAENNYVYYKNPLDFGRLYRTTLNSRESYKISDDEISYINVIGGWIYYSNATDHGRIYKLWAQSGYKTRLGNDAAEFINISDGWVYYRNNSDFGKLYKIRTNGADHFKLTDDNATYINVAGEWVYYSNKSDKGSLYKIKTDGTEQQKLNDDNSAYLNIDGCWLYYVNRSENNKLYKIGKDGNNKTKLSDDNFFNVNVSGGWAYYRNESDGGKLYKAKVKGLFLMPFFSWIDKLFPGVFQKRVKLNNDINKSISVVDDWLYYFEVPDNAIYKIKTDGSRRQIVE